MNAALQVPLAIVGAACLLFVFGLLPLVFAFVVMLERIDKYRRGVREHHRDTP